MYRYINRKSLLALAILCPFMLKVSSKTKKNIKEDKKEKPEKKNGLLKKIFGGGILFGSAGTWAISLRKRRKKEEQEVIPPVENEASSPPEEAPLTEPAPEEPYTVVENSAEDNNKEGEEGKEDKEFEEPIAKEEIPPTETPLEPPKQFPTLEDNAVDNDEELKNKCLAAFQYLEGVEKRYKILVQDITSIERSYGDDFLAFLKKKGIETYHVKVYKQKYIFPIIKKFSKLTFDTHIAKLVMSYHGKKAIDKIEVKSLIKEDISKEDLEKAVKKVEDYQKKTAEEPSIEELLEEKEKLVEEFKAAHLSKNMSKNYQKFDKEADMLQKMEKALESDTIKKLDAYKTNLINPEKKQRKNKYLNNALLEQYYAKQILKKLTHAYNLYKDKKTNLPILKIAEEKKKFDSHIANIEKYFKHGIKKKEEGKKIEKAQKKKKKGKTDKKEEGSKGNKEVLAAKKAENNQDSGGSKKTKA